MLSASNGPVINKVLETPKLVYDVNRPVFEFRNKSHVKKCKLYSGDPHPLLSQFLATHLQIYKSQVANYQKCRIPVQRGLNIDFWRRSLCDYWDKEIVELLEFRSITRKLGMIWVFFGLIRVMIWQKPCNTMLI